ncbi:MAG: hypothetical protein D6797_08815, partial [Bdellovibrio sp.]
TSTGGNEWISIYGKNFFPGTSVKIGSESCQKTVIINPTEIRCLLPYLPPNTYDVVLESPFATGDSLKSAFTYSGAYLVILPPQSVPQNTSATVTIQAQDAKGALDPSFNGTVTLNVTGSALINASSNSETLTLTNGVATASVSSPAQETVQLSLSNNSDMDISSTESLTFLFQNLSSTYFDGVDDYADAGNAQTLLGGASLTQMTLSFWVKASTTANYDGLFGAVTDLTNWTDLFGAYWTGTSAITIALSSSAGVASITTPGLQDFRWHHIAVTFDGSLSSNQLKLYLDGLLETEVTTVNVSSVFPPNANFEVGRILGPSGTPHLYNFNGYLDELAIWNKALSAEEILSIYNFETSTDLTLLAVITP